MTASSSIVPSNGTVLVTGVSGFIGSYIVDALLELGYTVRGTVRSPEKAVWVTELMAQRHPSTRFEIAVVPDLGSFEGWDDLLVGIDGVAHTAGDMTFNVDPNKAITPMIEGLGRILQAAANQPSIKRFVYTSSDKAIYSSAYEKEVVVDGTLWNDEAVEDAWRPPPYEPSRIWNVYAAMKTQCEQEVWKFVRDQRPSFVTNAVLPSFTVGPKLHAEQNGSSGKWITDFWDDPGHFEPLQNFGASWFVAVEDQALLHVAGLTQEDVKNERLLGFAEKFNFNTWVRVFRQMSPSRTWPEDDPKQGHNLAQVDTTREVELLERFGHAGWARLEDSVWRNCFKRC